MPSLNPRNRFGAEKLLGQVRAHGLGLKNASDDSAQPVWSKKRRRMGSRNQFGAKKTLGRFRAASLE
ncbi:MAG: hypothetical protein K0M40_10335 [Prolixibacteraceae bacterium]|nr:hypothetical protein [Prolixibacteraceae bacterium]